MDKFLRKYKLLKRGRKPKKPNNQRKIEKIVKNLLLKRYPVQVGLWMGSIKTLTLMEHKKEKFPNSSYS